ncbi:dodecin [Oryzihumus sp.]|uniref:dodecin n=1 Tax=Oryzihumus sp. TaxID=1968903 RepID=UPI002ED862EB
MSGHVYRVIEVVGSSPDSVDAAIRNAIDRVGQTTRHLDWFEVSEIRGQLDDSGIAHIQVGLKVGFRIEQSED